MLPEEHITPDAKAEKNASRTKQCRGEKAYHAERRAQKAALAKGYTGKRDESTAVWYPDDS